MKVLIVNDTANVFSNVEKDLSIDYEFFALSHESKWRNVKSLAQALVVILRHNYDILHINFGLYGFLACFSIRPTIVHFHGTDLRQNLYSPVHSLPTLLGLVKAKKVFVSTPDLLSLVPRFFLHKTHFIPNPIRDDLIAEPKVDSKSFGRISVLSISKNDPTKGITEVRSVIEALQREDFLSCLQYFSFGKLAECELDALHGENIYRNDKPISNVEVIRLIDEVDLVIGQMELGAIGVSELEALARGAPVVSKFDYATLYEDVNPFIFEKTIDGLVDRIQKLFRDPALLFRQRMLGQQWVLKHHSSRTVAKIYMEHYHDISKVCS